ncbi:MAG: hypothetical protein ACOYLB_12135 [Phototrophicaceae bacterium]
MENKPVPPPIQYSRVVLYGVAMAIMLIGTFLGLWFGLATFNIPTEARLIVAICTAPLLLSVGAIIIAIQRNNKLNSQ